VTTVQGARPRTVTARDHVRAVLLLPFVNTVVVPGAILASAHGQAAPDWPTNVASAACAAVAAALLLGGAALAAHCILRFARSGNGTLAPWDPPQALVIDGAYGYMRNPMKAGLLLILLGEAMLWRSLPLLAWFVAFALANVIYIRMHEEPGLRRRFGARYRDYCAVVPRWRPRCSSVRGKVRA
jgi:protein-S-isoprenylcysteine O-methyltransferase Ste14